MGLTNAELDLSDREDQGATALCSLKTGHKGEGPGARQTQADERQDFSDISSCAEDDVDQSNPAPSAMLVEDDSYIADAEEECDPRFAIEKLRNPSGDEVYLFSQLYTPATDVLTRYRKQTLAMRVRSGKELSVEDAYQQYKQACKRHRAALSELYSKLKTEKQLNEPEQRLGLLEHVDDYEVRRLRARIRDLERRLGERKREIGGRPVPRLNFQSSHISPLAAIDTIRFELPLPTKRLRESDEFACKYPDPAEDLTFRKQILVQTDAGLPLYLNKTEEAEPLRAGFDSLIEKLKRTTGAEKPPMADAVIIRRPFVMEFRRKPGQPGRIEQGVNPLDQKPAKSSEPPPSKVFSIRKPDVWCSIPTRINTEINKYEWLNLVFERPEHLHRETSRAIYNLADPRMRFRIPDKAEPTDVKEDPFDRNSSEEREQRRKIKDENIKGALQSSSGEDDRADAHSNSGDSESKTTNPQVLPSAVGRTTTLKHSQPAYDYIYLNREWSEDELRRFHRPLFLVRGAKIKVKVLSRETASLSQSENITAHNRFKSIRHLSLRKGSFAFFEYIEKRPHLLSNYGMASKLKRYFKGSRSAYTEFPQHVGDVGLPKFCEGEDNVPLIGQLQEYQSLAILENNMTRTPVFNHTARSYDFLLIKRITKDSQKCYIRRLERVFTAGQQEPKKEVFIPKSRNTNNFLQNRNQAFIYNLLHEKGNKVTMQDLMIVFKNMNESTIRKTLKQMGCEQEKDQQYWTHPTLISRQQIREKVTPEDVCQYESMRAGQISLTDKGISITSVDKLENAVKKVKSETDDKVTINIANWIEWQLLLTPWNLTNSYISTKLSKGMMQIDGPGDPTSGNCGYCFIKVPMKLPHGDRSYFDGVNDPSKFLSSQRIVTGTDADLRKLSMNELMKKLMTFPGVRRDKVENLTRWERVGLLKYLSSQAAKDGKQGSITKYARGTRLTTKMMREEYQKSVNDTFEKMIAMLGKTREYREDREEENTTTTLDLTSLPQETPANPQSQDFLEDIERKEQEDRDKMIKEIIQKQQTQPDSPRKPAKIQVLRKETRTENPTDKTVTVRVQYIRDPKEIEEHFRRLREEEKEQSSILPKVKKGITSLDDNLRRDKGEEKKGQREDGKRRDKDGETESQITCSRCGQKGHMKTNRKCPMYTVEHAEPSESERKGLLKPGEGLKYTLSIPLIDSVAPAKKSEKKQYSEDYLKPKAKPRRRNLPDENQYDDITHKLFLKDVYKYFQKPVKEEDVPDYYTIITSPISLEEMKNRAREKKYTTAQMLLDDLDLLVRNAETYNGYTHDISQEARRLRDEGLKLLREKELLVEIPMDVDVPKPQAE